ncbi:MAG: sigma-70 family RNA polymerase sigma factor [bacterium]
MKDRDLIAGCIAGDNAAWRLLLERHGGLVHGAIVALLARFSIGEPAVAEDIFAAVVEKLLADDCAALRQFKSDSKFTTYLVTIARNKTYDHLRATRRRPTVSLAAPIPGSEGSDQTTLEQVIASALDLDREIETRLTLEEILQSLPTRDRLILKLYYIEGMKDKDIAELLDLSADAVSARKSRALKRLKASVGESGPRASKRCERKLEGRSDEA